MTQTANDFCHLQAPASENKQSGWAKGGDVPLSRGIPALVWPLCSGYKDQATQHQIIMIVIVVGHRVPNNRLAWAGWVTQGSPAPVGRWYFVKPHLAHAGTLTQKVSMFPSHTEEEAREPSSKPRWPMSKPHVAVLPCPQGEGHSWGIFPCQVQGLGSRHREGSHGPNAIPV